MIICSVGRSHFTDSASLQQQKAYLPPGWSCTGIAGRPAVSSGCTVGAEELGGFVVRIPKYSSAALGVIPGSAMYFLGDFVSPHFLHFSV